MVWKRWLMIVMVGLLVSGAGLVEAAEEDLRDELRQAQEEIKQLRMEVAELKKSSVWQYQGELKKLVGEVPAAAKEQAQSGLILPAGFRIQPYGYFKLDMSYDDSAVQGDGGDYIIWVKQENDMTRADDAFSVTARQTRLGARVYAPNIGDLEVMGRVEIGFYNPEFAAENKSTPMLRHAYGQVTGKDWSLLFGQTSDIISPLVPATLNYSVGWFGGNIGYRNPQLRFTKWWSCPDEAQVKIETALSRQIRQDADGLGIDDGQDTGLPSVLARLSYAMPWAGKKKCEAGVSGHYGKEEIDWDEDTPAGSKSPGDDDEVHSWSLNADLVVPLTDTLEIKGEAFWGENI